MASEAKKGKQPKKSQKDKKAELELLQGGDIGSDGGKKHKKERDPSKPRRRKAPIIIAAALVVLIGGGIAAVVLNLGGVQTTIVTALTQTLGYQDGLDDKRTELATLQQKLTDQEADLRNRTAELDQQKTVLDTRAQSLTDQEAAFEAQTSASTGEQEELTKVAKIYDKMDPSNVASIFASMDRIDDIVSIVSRMNKSRAAAVLALMDPAVAANISLQMMRAG